MMDSDMHGSAHSPNLTSEQIAQWSTSWSSLSLQEYWRREQERQALSVGEETETKELVHIKQSSKTKLPDGRLSILVDLGSRINVIGSRTLTTFQKAAEEAKESLKWEKRTNRLHVSGVGSDAATCDWQVLAPIAVKFQDHDASKETYKANVAEGCGADLPAIWGSVSMQEQDTVLILRKGKEMIALPGPGGYKIEWSPGTRLLPMTPAPSGHLVVPCDRFDELKSKNQDSDRISFWTDHTHQD